MLKQLFPQPVTNDYRGARLARWVFVLLTATTIARSLVHVFAPDGGAQSIATIPLDTFTTNGAAAVIHVFALWGLSQLLLGLFYLIVLWRYQALIPLMYLLLVIEYTGRLLLTFAKPFEVSGTAPGGVSNYVVILLALLMLLLSLREQPLSRLANSL